jgi:uncharacterized protein
MTLQRLESCLRGLAGAGEHVVIALSGGVDSSLLAAVAGRQLGGASAPVSAVTITSELGFARDANAARAVAAEAGIEHVCLPVSLLDDEGIRANGPDRCYWCKRAMFMAMRRCFGDRAVIMDGTTADDDPQRPGMRAAAEHGVVSPLARAGLLKEAVCREARLLGVSTHDRPSDSCRATRIATGTDLRAVPLIMVETIEELLLAKGLRHVRLLVDELMITARHAPHNGGIVDSLRSDVHALAARYGYERVRFAPWEHWDG